MKGLNFSVEEGEFVVIIGKCGCGKTNMMKLLGIIDKHTDGKIRFMKKDTRELYGDKLADICRKQMGLVFQDVYLMDSFSVEENIMLRLILGKEKVEIMTKVAKRYADQSQISHLLKKHPCNLLGDKKQRVNIGRVLINDLYLILTDESTGNLDSKFGKIVINSLIQINREFRKNIVMVLHDLQIASYCQRIIYNGLIN